MFNFVLALAILLVLLGAAIGVLGTMTLLMQNLLTFGCVVLLITLLIAFLRNRQ